MDEKLKALANRIADYLNIELVDIKFEDIGNDDSRLNIKEKIYISISNNLKDDYEECAKCIAHELRHLYQLIYIQNNDDELSRLWKEDFSNGVNSSNMNTDGSNYTSQIIELDAYAFTKYYLENYEGIKAVNKIEGYEKFIDLYIEKYKDVL